MTQKEFITQYRLEAYEQFIDETNMDFYDFDYYETEAGLIKRVNSLCGYNATDIDDLARYDFVVNYIQDGYNMFFATERLLNDYVYIEKFDKSIPITDLWGSDYITKIVTPDKFRCVAQWNQYDGYSVIFINEDYVNKRKETIELYELDDRKAVIDMIKQYGFKKFDFNIVTEEEYVDEIRDTICHINDIKEDEFDLFIDIANHDDALTEWERDEWKTRREKEEE